MKLAPEQFTKLIKQRFADNGEEIADNHLIPQGQNQSGFVTLLSGKKYFVKYAAAEQVRFEQSILNWLLREQVDTFDFALVQQLIQRDLQPEEKQNTESELLVTSFIESNSVSKSVLLSNLDTLIEALIELHSLPEAEFSHLSSSSQLGSRWSLNLFEPSVLNKELVKRENIDAIDALVEAYEQALEFLKSEKHQEILSVCHGDLSADNLLFSKQRFALLDWEYAKITDVRWDLATIAVEFQLSTSEYQRMCRQYVQASQLKHQINIENFCEGAVIWRDIYRFISLHWAINHKQPIEKYLFQT